MEGDNFIHDPIAVSAFVVVSTLYPVQCADTLYRVYKCTYIYLYAIVQEKSGSRSGGLNTSGEGLVARWLFFLNLNTYIPSYEGSKVLIYLVFE